MTREFVREVLGINCDAFCGLAEMITCAFFFNLPMTEILSWTSQKSGRGSLKQDKRVECLLRACVYSDFI